MKECQTLIWLAAIIAAGFVTGLLLLAHHLIKEKS